MILPEEYIKDLNYSSINKNIEHNLNLIAKYPRESFVVKQFIQILDPENFTARAEASITEIMITENLIEISNGHFGNLTKFGYEVHRNGGWLKHLERENYKKQREDKKNLFEFNISKWKYYTFWWLFLISISATVFGIINFESNRELENKSKIESAKFEKEIKELKLKINSLQVKKTEKKK